MDPNEVKSPGGLSLLVSPEGEFFLASDPIFSLSFFYTGFPPGTIETPLLGVCPPLPCFTKKPPLLNQALSLFSPKEGFFFPGDFQVVLQGLFFRRGGPPSFPFQFSFLDRNKVLLSLMSTLGASGRTGFPGRAAFFPLFIKGKNAFSPPHLGACAGWGPLLFSSSPFFFSKFSSFFY